MDREFKGIWIPKEIWENQEFTALDKIIFAEIDSLNNENGCSASNEYLAEFCKCSATKISNSISKLIELGYIYQESFNGRTRVLKSVKQTYKICKADLQKMQGNKYNTIIINKEDNIKIKENKKHIFGEYKHVRLTDNELERLNKDYGEQDTLEAIKYLDEYIEMKGASYKNHNLVLRKWVFDACKEKKQKNNKDYEQHQYTKKELDDMFDSLDDIVV